MFDVEHPPLGQLWLRAAGNPGADGKTPIRWHNQLKIEELPGWISMDADSVDASLPPS
jgi:hypothetical protein